MIKTLVQVTFIAMISTLLSLAYADEMQMQYQQKQLPDGSTEMNFSRQDGAKVRQVRRPDGTIETYATDSQGNMSTMVQHPDGKVDVKTNKP